MPEQDLDFLNRHITQQFERISSENGIRNDALRLYTDEGFNALRRSLDQFRDEFHDYIQSLHTEIDRRFLEAAQAVATAANAQQRAIDAALISAEKAVDKANTANEKRFEGVNEFRGQLTDQAATFIARPEYASTIDALGDKVDTLDSRLTGVQGAQVGAEQVTLAAAAKTNSRLVMLGLVISAVVVVINVFLYYIAHK